ncbi:MAG: iron export ABC transporter permease subunit FetB [Propionicimonas sp.]
MNAAPISNLQLALAAGLLLISLALSGWLRLGLGKDILIAAVRMVVQLLLVGLILGWVFTLQDPWLVLGIGLIMTFLAAHAASRRPKRFYPTLLLDSFVSILVSSFLLSGLVLNGILFVQPWYAPQYLVPILGMVLGNSLTGVSLSVDRFIATLDSGRGQIEGMLAVGATRREAALPALREALRAGMIPTLNSMAVMGIVSLPGMMTGQILAGASPESAVRYQIVIMFVIAASTALGCLLSLEFAYRRIFDVRHRLRLERLRVRG